LTAGFFGTRRFKSCRLCAAAGSPAGTKATDKAATIANAVATAPKDRERFSESGGILKSWDVGQAE
jgi:hypothetical protein